MMNLKKERDKPRRFNIRFIISLLILILVIVNVLSSAYYGMGDDNGRGSNAIRVSKTMLELTMPNMIPTSGWSNLDTFFQMESSYDLEKEIGKERKSIGKLKINMFFNNLQVDREWNDGSLDVNLYFVYPKGKEEINYNKKENRAWTTLEVLPKGTVAEIAISFDKTYTLDEIYKILSKYDMELLWFATETGVEEKLLNKERGDFRISLLDGLFGFPNNGQSLVYEPESPDNYSLRVYGDVDKKEAAFARALEYLIKHEAWAKKAYRGRKKELLLKERLDYIEENGIRIYGVVVTGPSKELLKLKELEEVKFASLGEVTLWNWMPRQYKGTMYN